MSHPSQSRPYQGYPYTEPAVFDAPSISAAEASRWQHLPRRPVVPVVPGSSSSRDTLIVTKNGQKIEEWPAVYINIPEDENQATTSQGAGERQIEIVAISEPQRKKSDAEPVVYIDIPENVSKADKVTGTDYVAGTENKTGTENVTGTWNVTGAGNVTGAEETNQNHENFVEATIFYDPFEDRRIGVNKSERSSSGGDSTPDSPTSRRITTNTLEPTTSQDLRSPQSSVPPFMSKEAFIYTQPRPVVDDGLRLSPLPVSSPPEFPDPPPAYTEVDERRQTELPRTQVIVPESSAVARTNASRKLILCPYCGRRVLTLVVRESGILTHVLGTIFLIACFPMTICIYCTDWCKYRNHYCPQCNQLIAYEVPILCQDMVYNKV